MYGWLQEKKPDRHMKCRVCQVAVNAADGAFHASVWLFLLKPPIIDLAEKVHTGCLCSNNLLATPAFYMPWPCHAMQPLCIFVQIVLGDF
jgi:hypothetical protein